MIHSCWVALGFSEALMNGSPNNRTDMSIEVSRHGRTSTASPIHSLRPARGAGVLAVLWVEVMRMTVQPSRTLVQYICSRRSYETFV